jgi:SAM-dependent methyltransferase
MKKQKQKSQSARSARETNPNLLRPAMIRKVDGRATGSGELRLPCAPSLLDDYMRRLTTIFETYGKPFNEDELARVREILERKLRQGFEASAFSQVVITWETQAPPLAGIKYNITTNVLTMADEYERWTQTRDPPLFGKHPDAKVLALAETLGPPESVPVLDVGAGTGRNALALARLGHPTDAVEPAPALVAAMKAAVEAEKLPVNVIEGDALDPAVDLPEARYKLIVAAEVIASHFRHVDQVRGFAARMCDVLAPGGVLLFDAFLTSDGYKPDAMARELSQVFWSCLFTRHEIKTALEGLPLTPLTDESENEFEHTHLAEAAWPPTSWYDDWSQGLDLFHLPAGKSPVELRWLTYRRS